MIYYVVKEDGSDIVLGSYYSLETATRYNPGVKIHEGIIYTESLGFSEKELIVRGYSYSENGKYCKLHDEVRPTGDLVLYGKMENGDWIPVSNVSTGGVSKLSNKYKQSLLLERMSSSTLTPLEALEGIDGDLKHSEKVLMSIYDD